MDWKVQFGEKSRVIRLPESYPDNAPFNVEINGKSHEAKWQRATKTLFVRDAAKNEVWRSIHCRTRTIAKFQGESDVNVGLEFTPATSTHTLCYDAVIAPFFAGQDGKADSKTKKPKVIRSQMTGKVLKILVSTGMPVSAGDTLLIVEAMKMENRILASTGGVIDTIKVKEGDSISNGAELVKFK